MRNQVLAAVTVSMVAVSGLHGQTQLRTFNGTEIGQRFGSDAVAVGDVDQDGVPDLAIGAPHTTGFGRTLVYSGADGKLIREFVALAPADQFGASVTAISDIDLDGVIDFAIGAPAANNTGAGAGLVCVMSGETGAILRDHFGGSSEQQFGTSIDLVGDVNLDGVDEYIAGGPGASNRAAVFNGVNGQVLYELAGQANTQHGRDVGGGGDATGDGIPDMLVTAPSQAVGGGAVGVLRIYSGANGQLVATYSQPTTTGESPWTADFTGDVNADGRDDILVGSRDDLFTGPCTSCPPGFVAQVISGANQQVIYEYVGTAYEGATDDVGASVAALGDVDGDAIPDFAFGAPGFTGPTGLAPGKVRVFAGGDGSLLGDLTGDSTLDRFGAAIGGVGDLNQDGVPDLLIGAPDDDDGALNGGRVFAVSPIDAMVAPLDIDLGSVVKGKIGPFTGLHAIEFTALEGTKLKFKLKPSGKGVTRMALLDDQGQQLDEKTVSSNAKLVKWNVTVAESGRYGLLVEGTGKYNLQTGRKLPSIGDSFKTKVKGTTEVEFLLGAGPAATVDLKLTPNNGPFAFDVALTAPDASTIDLSGATALSNGGLKIKDVPLSEVGVYALRISGITGDTDKLNVKVELDQPKGKTKVDHDV